MKIALPALVFTVFANIATAQENLEEAVPTNVIEAFHVLYPRVKEVAWNYREPNFEASFVLHRKAVSLVFDESGYVTEVKNQIMEYELPTVVNELLVSEYSGWKVDQTSHIDVNGTGYYEAVVEKEKQTIVLVFTGDGGLMIKVIL